MPEIANSAVWSQVDASNNTGTQPSWSGSADPNTIDDAGRAMMGAITREWNWRSYTLTAGGTADAKTLTYAVAPAAYYTGQRFAFISNTVNTGTCTLNVNTLGAKTIKKDIAGTLTALSSGDMPAGRYVEVAYNGTDFVWVNYGTVQDLSGYAALASANAFTAAQTATVSDAATTTVTDVLSLGHSTSGTAAAGFGTGLLYKLEDGGGTLTSAASIDAVWVDATDTSEDSKISFKTMAAGAAKAEAAYIGQGLVVGSATGGDKGAGTVNATGFYVNGVLSGTTELLTAQSVGTGTTYTISSSTITAAFKRLVLTLNGVSHDNASNRSLQIEISGNNGSTWTTALVISGNQASTDLISGRIEIGNAAVSSGTRPIMSMAGVKATFGNAYMQTSDESVATGSINAIRLSLSGAGNFDAGTASLVGYA